MLEKGMPGLVEVRSSLWMPPHILVMQHPVEIKVENFSPVAFGAAWDVAGASRTRCSGLQPMPDAVLDAPLGESFN
jgi:hypothetical protein